jgi:hypothetical protein
MSAASAVAGVARDAPAEAPCCDDFDVSDWTLGGRETPSRRALIVVPKHLATSDRTSALVLLHGLGETTSESAGVRAWIDRYGLLEAHRRLRSPPIAPNGARGDLPLGRAREITAQLTARPFRGQTIYVCPFTPNVYKLRDPGAAIERLATWFDDVLLPEVRSRTPVGEGPIGLDGCSLGGHVGLDWFLRRPRRFATWGGVQAAINQGSAPRWAARLAQAASDAGKPRPLHIETSRGDPFHDANVALSRELERRAVAHELCVFPGPHDQPWLREIGTLAMLLWHDRTLNAA